MCRLKHIGLQECKLHGTHIRGPLCINPDKSPIMTSCLEPLKGNPHNPSGDEVEMPCARRAAILNPMPKELGQSLRIVQLLLAGLASYSRVIPLALMIWAGVDVASFRTKLHST